MIEVAPEGFQLVNDGRIFTPFVGARPTIMLPGIWGGANWPPSAYDPVRQRLFVCASSVVNGYAGGGDPNLVPPRPGSELFTGGAITFAPVPRAGIIAALDVTTNKVVWRYRADHFYSVCRPLAGLLFVGAPMDSHRARPTPASTLAFQTGSACTRAEHVRYRQTYVCYSGSALLGSPRGDSVWLFFARWKRCAGAVGAPSLNLAHAPCEAATATTTRARDANLDAQQLYTHPSLSGCEACNGGTVSEPRWSVSGSRRHVERLRRPQHMRPQRDVKPGEVRLRKPTSFNTGRQPR